MKKSQVAVGVIVALGAVWTGASWYTGKQIESRLDGDIQKLNTKLAGNNVAIQAKDFQRGIFSSDVRLIVSKTKKAETAGNPNEKNEKIENIEKVVLKSHIKHGPFPTFSLFPKLLSVNSELEQDAELKELFDITGGKSLFNIDTTVGYSGDTSTNISLIPVEYTDKEDGSKLSFSGANISADITLANRKKIDGVAFGLDSNGLTITEKNGDVTKIAATKIDGKVKLDSNHLNEITLKVKGDEFKINLVNEKREMTLKGVNLNIDNTQKGQFDSYPGEQSFTVDEISGKGMGPTEGNFLLSNFKLSSKTSETKDTVSTGITYEIGGIKINNLDLGSGKLALNANNLDGKSVQDFLQAYSAAAESFIADKMTGLPTDTFSETIYSNLPILLKNNPQFSIAPLSWKNSKGESSVNFKISLQNIPEDLNTIKHLKTENKIRDLVKELSLDVKLSKPMLIEQIVKSDELSGKDKAQAEKMANMQVQFMAAQGAGFGIVNDTENAIGLNLNYAKDKVTLNGKESDLHQFLLDHHLTDSDNQQDNDAEPAAE
ncbi:MAG: YdgA family protein [Enterobacteriaceae bacterium]|nr:YdgA family protein [Enterobacteriaceae bacterium]